MLLLIAYVCVMQDGIFLKEGKQGRLITNDVFDGRVFEPNNDSSLTGITALESFLMFLSYHQDLVEKAPATRGETLVDVELGA